MVTQEYKSIDLDRASFLYLLNKVFKDICSEFAIVEGSRSIALTASVREYPLLETELVVMQAAYFGSAGIYDWNVLDMESSYQDMMKEDRNWLFLPPQRPTKAYVYAGNLGLHPMPNISTPNDDPTQFPVVTIQTRVYPGDLGINSQIPIVFKSPWPFVFGVTTQYALRHDPAMVPTYAANFESEIVGLERYLGKRDMNHTNAVTPENYMWPVI